MLAAARVLVGFGLACIAAALGTIAFTSEWAGVGATLSSFAELARRGLLAQPIWRGAC